MVTLDAVPAGLLFRRAPRAPTAIAVSESLLKDGAGSAAATVVHLQA